MDEKLCAEKHKAVDEKIKHHESWLGEHEKKLDTLEKSDATNTTQISNLVKAMSSQTKAIWGLVASILAMLIGYVIEKI
jgi:predicted DNA-binding protein YlxM (UPF0122 family)